MALQQCLVFFLKNSKRFNMKNPILRHSLIIWLLMPFIFVVNSCSINPVTGKKELMLMSEKQEIAMGLQSDPSILANFGEYQNEDIQNFISEKGQKMAKISHRNHLDYHFKVLDSPVVNAFALPGGYVYFTRGILAHFNNEAEFAGVLGHEIGHVTARHSAKQYSQQMLAQAGFIIGLVVSEDFRKYADIANTGLGLLFLKFGRDHESESDRLGVEYSTKIGYDAHEMSNFFQTLSRISGGPENRIPNFMSTHPDPDDRHLKTKQMANKWQQKDNSHSSYEVNRNEYLAMIDGLVYGEDPRQGFVENDVFYHPELKFQYPVPTGWMIENTPIQVQMAPKDGKAVMILTLGQGNSLEQAAQTAMERYKLQSISSKRTTVNGLSALEVVADNVIDPQQQQQTGQEAQKLRSVSYFIQYNDLIYHFLGMTLL